MNTAVITDLCKQLDKARAHLEAAKAARAALNLNDHQETLRVVCGKASIEVSYLDRDTSWRSTLIRGREMILLGMQKVANAEIDRCRAEVVRIKQQIAVVAGGAA